MCPFVDSTPILGGGVSGILTNESTDRDGSELRVPESGGSGAYLPDNHGKSDFRSTRNENGYF